MYGPPIVVEYGSPYAEFVLKGSVTDTEGNALENIRVILKPYEGYPEANYTLRTNSAGRYEFDAMSVFPSIQMTVTAEDTDGTDNGGEFAPQDAVVELKSSDFTDGDGWYAGKAEKTVDFQLEEIANTGGDEE